MKTMILAIVASASIASAAHAGEPAPCVSASYPRLICTTAGCARLTLTQQCELGGIRKTEAPAMRLIDATERDRAKLTRLIASLG